MSDHRIEMSERKEEAAVRSNSWMSSHPQGPNRTPYYVVLIGLALVFVLFIVSLGCYIDEYSEQDQQRGAIHLSWWAIGIALVMVFALFFKKLWDGHFITSFWQVLWVFVSLVLFFIFNVLKTQAIPNSIFYTTITMRVAVIFGWLAQVVYTLVFLYILYRVLSFLSRSMNSVGDSGAGAGDAKAKQQLKEAQKQLADLEARNKALQKENADLVANNNAAANDKYNALAAEHEKCNLQHAAKNDEIAQLKRQVASLQAAASGNASDLQRENADLLARLAAAENAATANKAEADKAKADNARLQNELNDSKKQVNTTLTAFQQENSKDDLEIASLKKELNNKQADNARLNDENARLKAELEEARKQVGSTLVAFQNENSKDDMEIAALKRELAARQQKLNELEQKEKAKNDLIEQARAKWATLKPRFGCEFEDASAFSPTNGGARETSGTHIIKVSPDGPMQQAGVIIDDIIKSVQGASVEGREHFKQLLVDYKPLDYVRMDFKRNDDVHHTQVQVGASGVTLLQLRAIERIAKYQYVTDDDLKQRPF